MEQQEEQLKNWLEGEYLKSSMVQENDVIYIKEIVGIVDTGFGRKKFRFIVSWNNKEKVLEVNAKQYNQLMNKGTNSFKVHKTPFGTGFSMNFEPL